MLLGLIKAITVSTQNTRDPFHGSYFDIKYSVKTVNESFHLIEKDLKRGAAT